MGIVNNNLGCTYTLQARQLAAKVAVEPNRVQAGNIMEAADEKFADAATCFQLAIDDAEMLCSEESQRVEALSPPPVKGLECVYSQYFGRSELGGAGYYCCCAYILAACTSFTLLASAIIHIYPSHVSHPKVVVLLSWWCWLLLLLYIAAVTSITLLASAIIYIRRSHVSHPNIIVTLVAKNVTVPVKLVFPQNST